MIEGTGPGRGTPWWRRLTGLHMRRDGVFPERPGQVREGRTVAVIRPPRFDT